MGRNRRKAKAIVSNASDDMANADVSSAKELHSKRDDSRNVPGLMVIDYKKEATRAWKAFLTLAADHCLRKLRSDIESEMNSLDTLAAAGMAPPHRLSAVAGYQQAVMGRILELTVAEEKAKQRYLSNVCMLEDGEPFCKLPLIDPEVTLEALEEGVSKECSFDLNISDTCYISRQSSASRDSPDSAMHDMDAGTGSSREASEATALARSEPYDESWTVESDEEEYNGLLLVSATRSSQAEKTLDLLKPIADEEHNAIATGAEPSRATYSHYTGGVHSSSPQNISIKHISVSDLSTYNEASTSLSSDRNLSNVPHDSVQTEPASWCKIAATAEGDEWKTIKKRMRTVSQSEEKVTQPEPSVGYCLDYLNTKTCKFGESCKYTHVYNPQLNVRKQQQAAPSVSIKNADFPPSKPQDNALFQGEDGQKRRKTTLCRSFKKGECHWGAQCNYAHSEEELTAALSKLEKSKVDYSKVNVVKPEPPAIPRQGKLLMCKSFEMKLCKRPSSDCKYAHHPDELDPAFKHKEPCRKQQCPGRLRYERRKTAMCPDHQTRGKCIFGEECHYAHCPRDLRPLPKHELCSRFLGGASCVRASECVYAHYKKELRPLSPVLDASQPLASTAAVSEAVGSSKAAGGETAKESHSEPCTKQHCPGRLAHETRCTKLCSSVSSQTVCTTADCNKAHSAKELRRLPKYEMCSKYGGTKKCMPANECPYAHHKSEQRVKPSKPAATAAPAAGNAKGSDFTAKSASKASVKSANAAPRRDAQSTVDEECLICFSKVEEKVALECGHDRFHFWCISKWLNEGRPYCPCCNHPAIVPDVFQAPVGLEPSDFPSLGLH